MHRNSRPPRGFLFILGIRAYGTKYAEFSFAGKRYPHIALASGKGVEKNWGAKHTVHLKSGSASFDLEAALPFRFTPSKYHVIMIDVAKFDHTPYQLVNNPRRHVGTLQLNVKQLLDNPDEPHWYPLSGLGGYIRLQYSDSLDVALAVVESLKYDHNLPLTGCPEPPTGDFLGFPVQPEDKEKYACEHDFHLMTNANGRLWNNSGGLSMFSRLDNSLLRRSSFARVFWQGIPRHLRERIYSHVCGVKAKQNEWGKHYYKNLANKALSDRARLSVRATQGLIRGLDAASSTNAAAMWPPAAKYRSPSSDSESEGLAEDVEATVQDDARLDWHSVEDVIRRGRAFVDGTRTCFLCSIVVCSGVLWLDCRGYLTTQVQ